MSSISNALSTHRYGGITVGNIQKSIPASFGEKIPPMVRKIAVRRSAQVRNLHRSSAAEQFDRMRNADKLTRCLFLGFVQ